MIFPPYICLFDNTDPVWPEISKNPTSVPVGSKPPPPSNPTGFLNNSEISIISASEFLNNIRTKRQRYKAFLNDKTLPRSVRYHTQKAIEAMDKSSSGLYLLYFSVILQEKI
jgi:hypothetical protein